MPLNGCQLVKRLIDLFAKDFGRRRLHGGSSICQFDFQNNFGLVRGRSGSIIGSCMNLIILTPEDYDGDQRCVLRDHRADHIRSVLRAIPGQTVRIGMLNGKYGHGEIITVTPDAVELSCQFSEIPEDLTPAIDLICAVSRPKIMRKVLYVSAMMGVRRICFVRANRSEKSYLSSPLLTPEGARPHLIEGLSQGGFTALPKIWCEPLFRPFIEDRLDDLFGVASHQRRLLVDPRGTQTVRSLRGDCDNSHIVVAIGPEGGWVDFERGLFEQQQFVGVTLGPWTLRVEYAVTAILAQLMLFTKKVSA